MRRERSVRRLALIAFLAVALVFALPFATPAALAHANLVTADPTPNASLTTSPTRVTLHFSEAIAPSLSGIQVLNAQGKQVDNKDAIADPANSMTMWVTLPSLPDGTYTVVWHNTSDVDGHAIRSSYAFGIGVQVAVAPQTAQSKPPLLQSQGQPYLRWAVLIGAMAIVGGIAFRLLILEPVLTANTKRKHFEQARAKLLSRVSLLLWCTAALFIIASVALLMNQAGVVTDKDWYRTLGAPLKTFLIHTSYGKWWIWRMGCFGVALLALGVASRVESAAKREMADRLRSLALVASVVALLTFSLSSHGAAIAEVHGPAVMSDFIHLLSASVWGGGLLYLVLVVPVALSRLVERPRREFLAALVPRFSRLATISVAAILVSGLYNSWAQVSSVGASTQPYGLALIAKVALVVPLLVLGALNPKWISKRLAGDASAGNMLRVLVAGEAVLIVLVVLAAGWMTSLEPARTAHAREQNGGALRLDSNITNSGDLVYTLDIKPAQLGPNTLMLTVRTRAGGTRVANATDVRLTLTYLDKDLGSTPVTAQNVGGGRYVADNVLLSIAGGWQTEVFISRPGGFDFRDAVRFPIGGPGSSQAPGLKPLSKTTSWLLFGFELTAIGAVIGGTGLSLGGLTRRAGTVTMWTGVGAFGAGLAFLVIGYYSGGAVKVSGNPIAPTADSIAAGKAAYMQNCTECHGVSATGDGPLAAKLDPPPLNLVIHAPLHPESQLFGYIHDGISSTGMPPFKNVLTADQIWNIINYLKSLSETPSTPSPATPVASVTPPASPTASGAPR